ncbi:hypothetical protein N431DRAFT_429774 [Stipitochalara longipes BDJ]|nr:hypothetical protein N431DRAFT_429774 [Stipitochalara longipes BDJ]
MVLLGLSLLIASVTFLCYRHPPSSWSFLTWLQRPILHDAAKKQQPDAPPSISVHDGTSTSKETSPMFGKEEMLPSSMSKAELDRKAMPPPPPPFKKPAPKQPSTPTFLTEDDKTPTVPTFTLSSSTSSFPALNSPQRASSRAPPPSFPALNSAQRASSSLGANAPPRLPPPSSQGLMSPPIRSPIQLPNRTPTNATFSLAPPPTHSSIPTKPRKKVLLTPGHSPLDWARLSSSPSANLRGLPPDTPYLKVPPSLLKQMTGRKGKDAWTVLGGKVYNITPYAPYHPGGEPELMRAAGRDGSRLFGEVHPWVNWEGMLEGCLVGIAVEEGEVGGGGGLEEMD